MERIILAKLDFLILRKDSLLPAGLMEKIMDLFEQIKFEDETQCYMNFNVNDDGTLDYDRAKWKIVEPKLRCGWSKAHIFDILSRIVFGKTGWIKSFTLQVDKKRAGRSLTIKLGDVNVEISGDQVIVELGGVVNKNLNEIIQDVREGYLPRIMEEFENLDFVQLQVDVCYAQLKVRKCKDELAEARYELQETQEKLEEYKKNGGNYYG